jgi:phospholipid/cholesterol/gamma-HCH transport system substrate-binding protein
MNERQMQFRVGVVVFATMVIGGLLATLNGPVPTGWMPWWRSSYDIGIDLRQAPGVGPNTPVRKNGILIGRVNAIEDKDEGVRLNVEVDGNRTLYPEYVPHVRTTVLGDATVDFVTIPLPPGAQPVPDGTVFKGVVDPSPFDSLTNLSDLKEDFAAASRSLGNAGDEVAKLARRVNDAFGEGGEEGRVDRLLDTTERAMAQFANTMTSVNEIIGDVPPNGQQGVPAPGVPAPVVPGPNAPVPNGQAPGVSQPPAQGEQMRQRLRQGLNELPDAIHEIRVTLHDLRDILASAEKNLNNLEPFTEGLGEKGDVIADKILEAVTGINQLVRDFDALTRAINNREGSLGHLIHDPTTAQNLNTLMCNVNKVVAQIHDLTLRLRPVVDNARIFTDKVATEPGRLINGAVNPSVIK